MRESCSQTSFVTTLFGGLDGPLREPLGIGRVPLIGTIQEVGQHRQQARKVRFSRVLRADVSGSKVVTYLPVWFRMGLGAFRLFVPQAKLRLHLWLSFRQHTPYTTFCILLLSDVSIQRSDHCGSTLFLRQQHTQTSAFL